MASESHRQKNEGRVCMTEVVNGQYSAVHTSRGLRVPSKAFRKAKRLFDVAASAGLIVLLLPLFILIGLAVKVSSAGPIFYCQTRMGLNGRPFRFWKFRSMRVSRAGEFEAYLAENPAAFAQWAEFQKLDNDPRVTKVGRFIRSTSLDELPQLFNVLLGEMSMVGPRPCMPEQSELYGEAWEVYCSVRPGITGLWQVSGRNRLTYAQRVQLDVEYVRRVTLARDAAILLKTIGVVFGRTGR